MIILNRVNRLLLVLCAAFGMAAGNALGADGGTVENAADAADFNHYLSSFGNHSDLGDRDTASSGGSLDLSHITENRGKLKDDDKDKSNDTRMTAWLQTDDNVSTTGSMCDIPLTDSASHRKSFERRNALSSTSDTQQNSPDAHVTRSCFSWMCPSWLLPSRNKTIQKN